MNLAIITDWLVTYGGAEHVVAEFHAMFPGAPIFTTVIHRQRLGPLRGAAIRTTGLQPFYRLLRNHQVLLPWMPRAIENIDLRDFDVILSSSHAVAKGVIPPSTATHICYCHTPMRYAWEMEDSYLEDFGIPKILRGRAKKVLKQIRRWDLTTGKRVDHFIANSTETQERIARIYARDSVVISPPVDDRFFSNVPFPHPPAPSPGGGRGGSYYLALGRLVPYKKFDLLIETANALKLPLKIVGVGREEGRLKRMAGPTVEFIGGASDEALPNLYAGAKAFLFPPHEDAGIVPREAIACGTPVIAYGKGGARDAVIDGVTGLFFQEQSVASLKDAIEKFEARPWDRDRIRTEGKKFSKGVFRERVQGEINAASNSRVK